MLLVLSLAAVPDGVLWSPRVRVDTLARQSVQAELPWLTRSAMVRRRRGDDRWRLAITRPSALVHYPL